MHYSFSSCSDDISNEYMSKVSELTMTKDGELTGLEKTIELYYKILDLWKILSELEKEWYIWRQKLLVAEQIRNVLLLQNSRMAPVLSGTVVPELVPGESSLYETFIPVDVITPQPGENPA